MFEIYDENHHPIMASDVLYNDTWEENGEMFGEMTFVRLDGPVQTAVFGGPYGFAGYREIREMAVAEMAEFRSMVTVFRRKTGISPFELHDVHDRVDSWSETDLLGMEIHAWANSMGLTQALNIDDDVYREMTFGRAYADVLASA